MDEFEARAAAAGFKLGREQLRRMAIAAPILCFGIAIWSSGAERAGFVLLGLFLAAIVLPAVTRESPGTHGLAKAFRITFALTLLIGGLAGCAASVWLAIAGSYALLAALLIGPVSLVASYVGFIMLVTPAVPAAD